MYGWADGLSVRTEPLIGRPDAMSEALDGDLKFTCVADNGDTWYACSGGVTRYES